MGWINQTDGGRLRGPVVPNRLIIHVRGPGTLVALRGQDRIATLLNGKLQDYGFDIFEASWLKRAGGIVSFYLRWCEPFPRSVLSSVWHVGNRNGKVIYWDILSI